MTYVLVFLLAFPTLLLLIGLFGGRLATDSCVEAKSFGGNQASGKLFVLVHGMRPNEERLAGVVRSLQSEGQVVRLNYNATPWSNADPKQIATGIGQQIGEAIEQSKATEVVIVAHSMGALLSRRALLASRDKRWLPIVKRVVLLAGVNRGWDLGGEGPADADALERFKMRVGYWAANLMDMANLTFAFERGAPFVADLRLDWMRWLRAERGAPTFDVVQMLGDIDDVVSRDDNEDLRLMANGNFVQLTVRGTGHADILEFGGSDEKLGNYRKGKLLLAATAPFHEVVNRGEALRPSVDCHIKEVVFVLHGIRDLGRWSADFETAIDSGFAGRRGQLAIVSSRYGYFGMGPFLFAKVRARYVRWFMDQYTETLARYPNVDAQHINFFGHSNGTYILAEALKQYASMEIGRVVFAGSVVRRDFEWSGLMTPADPYQPGQQRPRVRTVTNYVGTQDWVVALFPRLFEMPVVSWLGNRIGSAGFNGFTDGLVNNITITGAHGAFDEHVEEIVKLLLEPTPPTATTAPGRGTIQDYQVKQRGAFGNMLAFGPTVIAVWLALVALVLTLGARFVGASPQPAWPVMVAFTLLMVAILRTV